MNPNETIGLFDYFSGQDIVRVLNTQEGKANSWLLRSTKSDELSILKVFGQSGQSKIEKWLDRDWPGWARVYTGRVDADICQFRREWIEGVSLSDALAKRERPLKESQIIRMAKELARLLAPLHRTGDYHGQLKPTNIILADSSPILTDPLMAAPTSAMQTGDPGATMQRSLHANPFYFSPEQVTGSPMSPATDIYALGCILFEAATGCPPFSGENHILVCYMQVSAAIPNIRDFRQDFSEDFASVISSMLTKDPAGRPTNADVLLEWLKRIVPQDKDVEESEFVKATKSGSREKVPSPGASTPPRPKIDPNQTIQLSRGDLDRALGVLKEQDKMSPEQVREELGKIDKTSDRSAIPSVAEETLLEETVAEEGSEPTDHLNPDDIYEQPTMVLNFQAKDVEEHMAAKEAAKQSAHVGIAPTRHLSQKDIREAMERATGAAPTETQPPPQPAAKEAPPPIPSTVDLTPIPSSAPVPVAEDAKPVKKSINWWKIAFVLFFIYSIIATAYILIMKGIIPPIDMGGG